MNEPVCSHCGNANDTHRAARPIPRVPHDGDFSLCLYCGEWSVFEGNTLRKPTLDEAVILRTESRYVRAVDAIRLMITPAPRRKQ